MELILSEEELAVQQELDKLDAQKAETQAQLLKDYVQFTAVQITKFNYKELCFEYLAKINSGAFNDEDFAQFTRLIWTGGYFVEQAKLSNRIKDKVSDLYGEWVHITAADCGVITSDLIRRTIEVIGTASKVIQDVSPTHFVQKSGAVAAHIFSSLLNLSEKGVEESFYKTLNRS